MYVLLTPPNPFRYSFKVFYLLAFLGEAYILDSVMVMNIVFVLLIEKR